MADQNVYISKEKKTELEAELLRLTTEGRGKIAAELDSAKALGDLKENAEYHQAREDQAHLEDRIRHIEETLKTAQIVGGGEHSVVEIGATVTITKKGSSAKQTYTIVGAEEVDPGVGKLSLDSPLIESMEGQAEGDMFFFETPSEEIIEYKIVEIK